MFRALFVGTIVIAAGIIAACQEPDPNYGDPSGIIGKKLPGESSSGSTSTSSGDSATASGSSGAPTAPAPTITVAAAHADSGGGGPAVPFSTDCLTCHGGTGPATAKFAFGGLVSNAAGAQVTVVVDGLQPVATDDAGYFWSTEATALAAGSSVNLWVNGASKDKMPGLAAGNAGGACLGASGCHGATSPGPIQL